MQNSYGAYLVPRRGGHGGRSPRGKPPHGHRRGIGALIAVLLLLTAVICLLIVFLPHIGGLTTGGEKATFGGKKFYFLSTAEAEDYGTAFENAQVTAARGGAGYIYNDGRKYCIIASVYSRESDVRALAAVNEGSTWFEISIPAASLGDDDTKALVYLTGEFFDTLYETSVALDRGTVTEAAADAVCSSACKKLIELAAKTKSHALSVALEQSGEFCVTATRPVLSYIRYVAVRAVALVGAAMS